MKESISKNIIPGGLGLALLILTGVSAISYRSMMQLVESAKWVQHTYEVQTSLLGLFSTIKEAEASRRGYIITGELEQLEPYHKAIDTIVPQIQNLRKLTADNRNQQRRLDILEPIIAKKLDGLNQSLALPPNEPNASSLQIALTEQGRSLMEQIRQTIEQMQKDEQQLLQQRSAAAAASVQRTLLADFTGTGLSFTLLLLVYALLHRENWKRRQAEEALRKANDELEIRVEERTAQLAKTNQSLQAEITERKRAEVALRESEERFRSLIENALDIITVLDAEGTVQYESPSVEKTLGYKPEKLVGQSFFKHVHPDDINKAVETFTHAVQNSSVALALELRFQHQNGSWLILETIGQKFLNPWGVTSIVVNSRDITERKKAEEVRIALKKEQELSEVKLHFFSMASHEFRTPLSTILISAQILESCEDEWLDLKKRRNLQRIQSSAKTLTNFLADIMTITRAEAGKLEFHPKLLDLEKFCRNLLEEMQVVAGTQHTIVFVSSGTKTGDQWPEEQGASACMDEKLLRSILTNLLSNAIKYSPAGGTVQFELLFQLLPIRDSEQMTNEKVAVFRIQDTGIGISSEDQKRLFESFHRGENVGNIAGAGLGLAVVSKCVKLHGGSIEVMSEVGTGTTFTVKIPLNN